MALIAMSGEKRKILSPIEWHESVNKKFHDTFKASNDAERIVTESCHLCNLVSARVKDHQNYTTQHLKLRAQSVRTLQDQLSQGIKDVIHETDLLFDTRQCLEKALKVLSGVDHLNSTCIQYRNQRPAPDLVKDAIDKGLQKERATIENSLTLLSKMLQTTDQQICSNREIKRCLERDWSNKVEHYDVEVANVELIQHPKEGQFRVGCLAPRKNFTEESTWNETSHSNLCNSKTEIEISEQMRLMIGRFLSDMSKDLIEGNAAINGNLRARVNELETSRRQFITYRDKVLEERFRIENAMQNLKRQRNKQDSPMKVAQSRLYNRMTRPPQEAFEDSAHYRLKMEVEMLDESMKSIAINSEEAERSRLNLLSLRRQFDRDIALKERSIFIDKDKCLPLRCHFPDSVKLAGF